jgi:hypothetical protein
VPAGSWKLEARSWNLEAGLYDLRTLLMMYSSIGPRADGAELIARLAATRQTRRPAFLAASPP